ncbi:hypothetical protein [Streptomyces sp. ST1015]|uniref:hypothetical protein n=1 Tax=Streptomyces sp. ST1015 TaxID=1848900 RepID=UPI0039779A92
MIKKWYGGRGCLDLINYVFRDQDEDPVNYPHYWGYDHDKLVQLFTEAGFVTVEPWLARLSSSLLRASRGGHGDSSSGEGVTAPDL